VCGLGVSIGFIFGWSGFVALWLSFALTGWSASAVRMGYGYGYGGCVQVGAIPPHCVGVSGISLGGFIGLL
jgi:hypothetical protein